MRAGRGEPVMRDDYTLVGSALEPFSAILGRETAETLHDFVAQSFMPAIMQASAGNVSTVPKLTEEHDVVKASIRYGTHRYRLPDTEVTQYTALRLTHQDHDSWKLRVSTSRYQNDGTQNKFTVRYFVDVVADQLMQAKQEVRILGPKAEPAPEVLFTDDPLVIPTEEETLQAMEAAFNSPLSRRALERNLTVFDCIKLQRRLGEAARLYKLMSS